jgi:hypothetical protein
MTQYKERIERQKLLLEAEEWAMGVRMITSFDTNVSRVWYDNREPEGKVMDVVYNDQRIERTILETQEKITILGQKLSGDELVWAYQQSQA